MAEVRGGGGREGEAREEGEEGTLGRRSERRRSRLGPKRTRGPADLVNLVVVGEPI